MRKTRGFTFTELLASVAITGLLVGVALPGVMTMMHDGRMTEQANLFISSLNQARGSAVRYGRPAGMCASSNRISCNGTDWSRGWIVWMDENGDGTLQRTERIAVHDGTGNDTRLEESSDVYALTFSPDGSSPQASQVKFVLTSADCSYDEAREIRLTPSGRPETLDSHCTGV